LYSAVVPENIKVQSQHSTLDLNSTNLQRHLKDIGHKKPYTTPDSIPDKTD